MRCIAYHNSHSGYHILYDVIMRSPVLSRAHLYCLHCIMAQRAGRPLTEVDINSVKLLKTIGIKWVYAVKHCTSEWAGVAWKNKAIKVQQHRQTRYKMVKTTRSSRLFKQALFIEWDHLSPSFNRRSLLLGHLCYHPGISINTPVNHKSPANKLVVAVNVPYTLGRAPYIPAS